MEISIIIPIYNASNYIIDCLMSVSTQKFDGNIECILVDDCGSDDSINLAQEYITLHDNDNNVSFSVLHQKFNQGPSAARNCGIREAHGEYVLFLDADDLISPDCVDLLYSLAKQFDLDYVQGMYHSDEIYQMPKYNLDFCNRPIVDRRIIKKLMLDYSFIPFTPHNRLVRRQFILEHKLFFPENIRVREDFYWMFFLAKYVERMAICDKETYFRGYNGESLTHNINKVREILAYRTLVEDFCENIDPFMMGEQKVLILDTLLMCLKSKYYADDSQKNVLIEIFKKHNSFIQCILLNIVLLLGDNVLKAKLVHLLNRLYRRDNQ